MTDVSARPSPVHCTLDLDAPAKQFGRLELPRSNNSSGWSHLFIPVITIRGGDGPTALVFGGVHGDEPEGQVAALNLARDTRVEDVPGRLIIVPAHCPRPRVPTRGSGLRARTSTARSPVRPTGRPTSSWPTSSAAS